MLASASAAILVPESALDPAREEAICCARRRLASLPIAEKLAILEKLRARNLLIAGSRKSVRAELK